jgi:hypothetical protein
MATTPVSRRIGGTSRSGSRGMKMPHERDESAANAKNHDELEPVQAEQMEQARQDLESGQQDTDCRSTPVQPDTACPQPESPPTPERRPRGGRRT